MSATALGTAAMASLTMAVLTSSPPARAQITVFDPNNYSQNLLGAARALQQIDNQIRSLQNEAQMLLNQARGLSRIGFPEVEQLTSRLQAVDRLMGQAQGIDFRIGRLDDQFRKLFPQQFDAAMTRDQQVRSARARLDTAMAAFRQTMSVQAQVVENVAADADTLHQLVARSQGAEGGLQAQQATNQLLALVAKQQFQIQNLMAAQYRAEATDAARRAQDSRDARGRMRRFLGSGSAYTQH
ncbi:MAG TPA: P-type conjugative transfer protein TrbJ [Sphingomonas sp.]|nr:P-type conjugative transfer protein TrbJ [Sphingomonas sp.]